MSDLELEFVRSLRALLRRYDAGMAVDIQDNEKTWCFLSKKFPTLIDISMDEIHRYLVQSENKA